MEDVSPEAITPRPTVTISEIPSPVVVRRSEQRPLREYWLTVPPTLPDANADGFRMHRGRRYVDVAEGGTVLVGIDPDTGQYRAGLPTERHASGPVLQRDADSGLWRPQEDVEPPSPTSSEPGSDGTSRPDSPAGRPAHRRLADRLGAIVNRLRTPQARAKRLFPSLGEEQISAYIRSLGNDVEGGLNRREAEYKTLKLELMNWLKQPSIASMPRTREGWAERVASEIKRCWRQETGTSLILEPGNGTLPPLSADFSHVRELSVHSVTWSLSADAFLAGFSHLEHLTVTRSILAKLPDAVAQMHNLNVLNLSANRIRLDTQSAATLGALSNLEHINLSGNPLGMAPDFSSMPGLKVLNLSNTQLDQWPKGLQNQLGLELVDLRNNRLQEIPQTSLNPPAGQLDAIVRTNGVTLIEGNDFAPGYWKNLEMYWRRLAADHPELANSAQPQGFRLDADIPEVAMVQRMYPNKDVPAAKDFAMELGDGELTRRVEEFGLLETQLEDYVAGKQNDASVEAATVRLWAPQRVARIIKACWLRESGELLRLPPGSGPLPALTADFSHVRMLDLEAVNWSASGDTFLANFTNLESLSINHSNLRTLPASVGEMDKLTRLDLSSNKLELDEQSAANLSTLNRLKIVNLSENPLMITPDFSAMSELTSLDLHATGISQWPTGLVGKAALTGLDLRNNRLSEVPQANLNPAPEQLASIARINAATLLQGNDFPSGYWRKFDGYWRRVSTAHPELMDQAHPAAFDSDNSRAQRYRRLYPGKTIKACREYLWSLPEGSAKTTLSGLEREFNMLQSQLDSWVFSGGGVHQGYIRSSELAINANSRADRDIARARILSCWRQETPQKLAFDRTPIGLELDLGRLTLQSLPDLDVDFSHVGSLKLNNMNLSTSPEGFLTRFRHVRWLDMSNNQLMELPPAVGQMNILTRLFLQNNQIHLTPDSARDLSGRRNLRALWMAGNSELGITPDFSQITDMRSLDLADTGIETFPTGLAEQPLLDMINLSNNQISTIPDDVIAPPDERLAQTASINNVTDISNNPLSDATRTQLTQYASRLATAGVSMAGPHNLFTTSIRPHEPNLNITTSDSQVARWLVGLSENEASSRRIQWHALRNKQGSDGLFNLLDRIQESGAAHGEVQRQVWKVIDAVTEKNQPSRTLRRELFERSCEAGCTDLAAATFTDLQIMTATHKARALARQEKNGAPLVSFSKGLFRLKKVDDIAAADIERSREIATDFANTREEREHQFARILDPHEMVMAYRFGLKDRLQLPFQPEALTFIGMARVTPQMLDAAYAKVIALDNSPEEFQALVSMDFWQDFVTYKYQPQFEASRQPFQDQQAILDQQFSAQQLAETEYQAQTNDLQAQLAIAEGTLIQTLTRQELQPRQHIEEASISTASVEEMSAETD